MLSMILGSGEFPGYSVFGSLGPNLGPNQDAVGSDPTSVALILAMVSVMPILIELAIQVIRIH